MKNMHDSVENMHDSVENMHDSVKNMRDSVKNMHDSVENMHDSVHIESVRWFAKTFWIIRPKVIYKSKWKLLYLIIDKCSNATLKFKPIQQIVVK